MPSLTPPIHVPLSSARHKPVDSPAWKAAQELEVSFLSEMLKSAGFGETRESFGGGAGEDQFSSFLREAQSREMVKVGGIGLAQHFFDALKENTDEQ